MFNSHNLPDSILNAVGNILENTNSDFDLPPVLQEAVADAAADYLRCPTQEDRKAIVEWHAEQVVDTKDLETQTMVNFARAVEYVANGGKMTQTKSQPKQIDEAMHRSEAEKIVADPKASKEQVARAKKAIAKTNKNRAAFEADKAERRAAPKTESNDYSHLLDVLDTLNESEFSAYIDLLSESELELLEQILVEAGFISRLASKGVSLYKGAKSAFNAGKKAYNKSQKNLEGRSLTIGFGPKKKPASPSKPERTSPKPERTSPKPQTSLRNTQTSLHNPQTSLYNPQTENQTKRKTDDDFDPNSKYANDYQAAAGRGDDNEVIRLGYLMRQGKNK